MGRCPERTDVEQYTSLALFFFFFSVLAIATTSSSSDSFRPTKVSLIDNTIHNSVGPCLSFLAHKSYGAGNILTSKLATQKAGCGRMNWFQPTYPSFVMPLNGSQIYVILSNAGALRVTPEHACQRRDLGPLHV